MDGDSSRGRTHQLSCAWQAFHSGKSGDVLSSDLYSTLMRRALVEEPRDSDFAVTDEEAWELIVRSNFGASYQPPAADRIKESWAAIEEGRAQFCGKKIVLKS
jgi:hypothetical protein